jgi:hypothetical protein
MDDCGIDPAFVHQADGLCRGKRRHLAMREVARQAGSPEVDLGVDDLHRILSLNSCASGLLDPEC